MVGPLITVEISSSKPSRAKKRLAASTSRTAIVTCSKCLTIDPSPYDPSTMRRDRPAFVRRTLQGEAELEHAARVGGRQLDVAAPLAQPLDEVPARQAEALAPVAVEIVMLDALAVAEQHQGCPLLAP